MPTFLFSCFRRLCSFSRLSLSEYFSSFSCSAYRKVQALKIAIRWIVLPSFGSTTGPCLIRVGSELTTTYQANSSQTCRVSEWIQLHGLAQSSVHGEYLPALVQVAFSQLCQRRPHTPKKGLKKKVRQCMSSFPLTVQRLN